jgi:chromate transporter
MNIIKLFFEFIKIGAFSFGGGLGTLPYIYEMANKTGWINAEYIGKILAVSQVTPGPLACNIGTITGFKAGGILGAFVANLGFVLPAVVFMTISYKFLNKIKNNEKANEVIKIVRCSALAVMLGSSTTLFKSAFLGENINYKNIIIAIIIFGFIIWNGKSNCKIKKINSLGLILISAVIAVVFKV